MAGDLWCRAFVLTDTDDFRRFSRLRAGLPISPAPLVRGALSGQPGVLAVRMRFGACGSDGFEPAGGGAAEWPGGMDPRSPTS